MMSPYAISAILICAVALAIYAIRKQSKEMMQFLKDWAEEEEKNADT
jgi:hypothetical protein